ncbi:neural proliferation differentiation and control protein 1a [Melanotaenia boesemani]|uniref:neural proliferation differentiation and control protein 1a n=1 Tax=Melanotaenia boesemani TaxID=1250792 RepID=UPI001C049CE1|nr:neural proliferation differentiation and control protein 1a [Melanotaenia boesemani]
MLLLSSPRCGRQRRASLLLAVVLLCGVPISASLPARTGCPSPLDCALEGRHHCQPGSSYCGSCLSPFEENKEGRCVQMKRHQHVKVSAYSDPDEEIDLLHSVVEKQEMSKVKPLTTQRKYTASLSLQADIKNSKTDAFKQKQKNQDRLSGELQSSSTAAPGPAETGLPNTPTPQPRVTGVDGKAGPIAVPTPKTDSIIIIMISVGVALGTVAIILATVCFIKSQRESHLAAKVDYPAFRGPGVHAATANGPSMGDKTLAQSAQMYHYQHQKQQMMSMGVHKPEQKAVDTEVTSDEEEVGGGFTVYECPGLAPTGEMEVKNPLFDDSSAECQGNQK